VAPHTAKIHTLITLGIRIRTKLLVFKARNVVPCGFDSHRPLHFQPTWYLNSSQKDVDTHGLALTVITPAALSPMP
jgi:hypothetical protein